MKRHLRRRGAAALSGLFLMAASTTALAEETAVTVTESDDSYGYKFGDDLLNGDGIESAAPRIVVRDTGRRDRLIRPRVHFVRELLMSVENL